MKGRRWVVITDTREQTPLPLARVIAEHGLPFEVETATMRTGDYCIKGLEHVCMIERKSLPDLAGCVGHDRPRFERELHRLHEEADVPVLLIEGTADAVLARAYPGTVHPNAILGSVASWSVDFGLCVHWCGSPLAAAHVALRLFGAVVRRVERATHAAG